MAPLLLLLVLASTLASTLATTLASVAPSSTPATVAPSDCGADDYCGLPDHYNPRRVARAMARTGGRFDIIFTQRSRVARSLPQPAWLPACRSRTYTRRPRIARNGYGHLRTIINSGNYIQEVQEVACEDQWTGLPSDGPSVGTFPLSEVCQVDWSSMDGVTRCEQQWQEHRLLTLDTHNNTVELDVFSYKSGCLCMWQLPQYD